MENSMSTVQIARYLISFAWLYHGLFPKIVHIAPLEMQMSGSIGFGEEVTYWFIKAAGVSEVIWAVVFFVFYRLPLILYLNILGLLALFFAVILLQPQLVIEAFNPVTTNLPLIALSFIILQDGKVRKDAEFP